MNQNHDNTLSSYTVSLNNMTPNSQKYTIQVGMELFVSATERLGCLAYPSGGWQSYQDCDNQYVAGQYPVCQYPRLLN